MEIIIYFLLIKYNYFTKLLGSLKCIVLLEPRHDGGWACKLELRV